MAPLACLEPGARQQGGDLLLGEQPDRYTVGSMVSGIDGTQPSGSRIEENQVAAWTQAVGEAYRTLRLAPSANDAPTVERLRSWLREKGALA